jgi:hypothetical protein
MESIATGTDIATGATLSEPPLRMAFLFWSNGVRPDYWTPAGDGVEYELTPHLQPLADLKSECLLLENLWHEKTTGRNGHWPKDPVWLSGGYVERTTRDLDVEYTSADQFAAQKLQPETPLPTFELGIDTPRSGIDTAGGGFPRIYGSFLSWRDRHTPVPKEVIPQLAFDRLFRSLRQPVVSSLNPKHPSLLTSMQRDDRSVLDVVLEEAKALRSRGSAADQVRLDEYFESVRSVEQRMEAALRPHKRWINKGKFPLDRPAPGVPEAHREHVRLMLDILILALWTDSTRIATFMFGDAQTQQDYSFLPGVKGGFHSLSHHGNVPTQREQYEKVVTWHVEQTAYFLNKMRSLKEGDRSLLDNSMVLFGSSLKDGNRHDNVNLPLMLAGRGKGTIRPGRRLRAPEKTPMCNLLLAMMQRMGVTANSFGDSTGALDGLA